MLCCFTAFSMYCYFCHVYYSFNYFFFFFFNDTATTEIYTLSLHDALPIFTNKPVKVVVDSHYHFDHAHGNQIFGPDVMLIGQDRKSTRLNSSHLGISYAVFCLKKKKKKKKEVL